MADKRPIFTENFSANLADIESFLEEEGSGYFRQFFQRLVDEVVPTVCRFPLSGRSFLERAIVSAQALHTAERMKGFLQEGDDLREFIQGEYLLLYLVRGNRIVFLSVKHHQQLSYDLHGFWQES
jgi:hypothetical protein